MYNLLTTATRCDDLFFGFDRSRHRRQRELTNKKNVNGKYHVRIFLKDIFGFAQHQLKGTYGLRYILTLRENNDSAVLKKDNAINNAKIEIITIHWYVPHYTLSTDQQGILLEQIQIWTPTELQYPERSIFMKKVNTQGLCNFEMGTQEGINVPIWFFVVFQQMYRQDSQNLNNDTFCRPPVTYAHVVIGTERYPDKSLIIDYDEDDSSQGDGQTNDAFKALTQDILQPFISEHDYRSSNDGDNIGNGL